MKKLLCIIISMNKGMPHTPPLLQLWQLLHGVITVELPIQAIITNYSENQKYVFLWKLKLEFSETFECFETLNKENNIIKQQIGV